MDEAKQRLEIIERALTPEAEASVGYIAVSDLCSVQFRKVFETIALGCLLVHGDIPGTNKLKDDHYRADKLLRGLERLHPNFFPVPCMVERDSSGRLIKVLPAVAGEWLTKDVLIDLYFKFDQQLHVGKFKKRKLQAHPVDRESLAWILFYSRTLLQNHLINLRDPDFRLVAELAGPGEAIVMGLHKRSPNTSP